MMSFLKPRIEESDRAQSGDEKVVNDRADFTAKFIAACREVPRKDARIATAGMVAQ